MQICRSGLSVARDDEVEETETLPEAHSMLSTLKNSCLKNSALEHCPDSKEK